MNFGNNSEKLGYYDSPWALTEVSADGNTIYKGRPSVATASEDDPVWYIMKITIQVQSDGSKMITTRCADGKNKWSERENLNYQYV